MLRRKKVELYVRSIMLLSVLAITASVSLRAQNARLGVYPTALSDSTRRVVFDREAFFGDSAAMPRWDNKYLVSRAVETYQAGPNVRLYDQSGEKVREAAIWFPGSRRVVMYSATVTADGRVIAAGSADKPDGTVAPFIAETDLAGKMTDVIQTKGFAPANICLAPDGTIWSFGGTGYNSHSEPNPGDTLRHFELQKGEVGSYLPRSAFPSHPGPETLAYIRCLPHEVVVYATRTQEYIEMKYGGVAPHVYRAEAQSVPQLLGFAATGSKEVYGYFSSGGNSGLYYLSFDEAASTVRWLPVRGSIGAYTKAGAITGLWGSDDKALLVSRAEDSAGVIALHWVSPIK